MCTLEAGSRPARLRPLRQLHVGSGIVGSSAGLGEAGGPILPGRKVPAAPSLRIDAQLDHRSLERTRCAVTRRDSSDQTGSSTCSLRAARTGGPPMSAGAARETCEKATPNRGK